MKLSVDLYVREHPSGFYTLQMIGDRSVQIYTDDLDAAREDLVLLLSDRIERTHPGHQSSFAPPFEMRQETITLEDAITVRVGSETRGDDTTFTALVGERRGWRSMYFPRLDLFLWVPKRGVDHEQAAQALLDEHFGTLSEKQRIAHRFDRREWVETLEVEAEPPALSDFTGKNRGLKLLPIVSEVESNADDDDTKDSKSGKKKRPPTPTLARIGLPLSRHAEDDELARAFERKRTLDELFAILTTKGHQCVTVVGPSGVGKTAVLNELVYRLRDPALSEERRTRPVWFADASRLVATDGFHGDWQRQVFDVARECEASNVIWYIGSLLPLLDAGKHIGSDQNVSQLLRPYLASRRITVVAEATEREWGRLELRDAGFARLFTAYRIAEPPEDEAERIVVSVVDNLERTDGVAVTPEGRAAAQELCRRYHSEGSALGITIAFLRRLVEYVAAKGETNAGRVEVVDCFCLETGLPQRLVRDDVPLHPAEVRAAFDRRLVGQDRAVTRMTDLVAVIKAGLSDLFRPLGSFLFVGPTGVGKTETAKALAQFLFGSEHRLIRFDMSEFAGFDAVNRFLGDANHEGKLVESVRRRPFSVVLLDEVEKSHPAVFDVLLQVLGEARLTDEAGRIADFRNAVIVMTSNLGVETLRRRVGFEGAEDADFVEAHFVQEAQRFFRPEFFNRIDHIVPFMPLEARAIRHITTRELDKLLAREGIRQRGLGLRLGETVHDWLAERGVEPKYGARPLKRTIERRLTIPLARHLARRRQAGALEVRAVDESLEFTPREAGESETSRARAKATVGELLRSIDLVRFRASRWMNGPDYTDLAHEVRLFEQLTRTKHFYADRELAERRSRGMEEKQVLVKALDEVIREVESVEDLAYEAYAARDGSPVEELKQELERATEVLTGIELDLYGLRFVEPTQALLYLVPGPESSSFLNDLIETYLFIAWVLGQKVKIFSAVRVEAKSTDAKKDKKTKKQKRAQERWRWKRDGEFAPDDPKDGSTPDEAVVRKWRQKEVSRSAFPVVFALSISGPHAAPHFVHEAGRHDLIGTQPGTVRVVFENGAPQASTSLKHPGDLQGGRALVRAIRERQHIVEDHVLGSHVAREPRLHRIYLELMKRRILQAALGRDVP